jgi:hypothetical protein
VLLLLLLLPLLLLLLLPLLLPLLPLLLLLLLLPLLLLLLLPLLLLLLQGCWSVQLQPLPGWHVCRDVSRGLQPGVYPGQLLADESPLPCSCTQHQHDTCIVIIHTQGIPLSGLLVGVWVQ